MRYVVWTALVWVPITVLAISLSSETSCGRDELCLGPSSHDIVVALVVIGLAVYFMGLAIIWGIKNSGSRWEK